MLINSLILAISSSIDSLGIGITYGIRKTTISFVSKLILFVISFCITLVSMLLGSFFKGILPNFIAKLLGTVILIFIGFFIIFQSITKSKKIHSILNNKNVNTKNSYVLYNSEKIYSFFIKCFGITIKIIKSPISSDFDKSNKIEPREALFLGIALSLDSLGIGICASIIDFTSILFPLFVSVIQLAFLNIGILIGKKVNTSTKIPENIWSIISGILLCLIGLLKILC